MGFSLKSFLGGAGGGGIANMIPGLRSFSPLISAGIGGALNKDNRLGGALQGFAGGGAGQALGSGIGGMLKPGGTFGKAFENFGSGAQTGAKNYMNAIPGMGGTYTGEGVSGGPQGKMGAALSRFFGGAGSGQRQPQVSSPEQLSMQGGMGGRFPMNAGASGPTAGATDWMAQQAQKATQGISPEISNASAGTGPGVLSKLFGGGGGGENIVANSKPTLMDQFGKAVIGTGIAGIGDMFAPKVETPNIAGIGADLQAQMQAGELGDPIAKQAGMQELLATLGRPMGEAPSSAFNLGDANNTQAMNQALLESKRQWKGLQPGVDYSNNPEFVRQQQEIMKQFADERTMQKDQTQFQYDQQQLTQKYNYMLEALRLDQSQMQQYIALADLQVDQLMLEYGISAQEAMDFKGLFSQFGQNFAEGGTPQPQSPIQVNLGQPPAPVAPPVAPPVEPPPVVPGANIPMMPLVA